MRAFLLACLVLTAACGEDGPTMRPGEDCKKCHDFSAAGTVFPTGGSAASQGINGVTVTLVDANQKTVTMTSNSAGNFYTSASIQWPADVTLLLGTRTATMTAAPNGACASCHTSAGSAQGRVFLP